MLLEKILITTLSIVNEMLGLLGELPVNDLDAFHPVVPRALASIDTAQSSIQADQWWFNVERPILVPQVGTKYILLPSDCLSVDSVARSPRLSMRDGRLYNNDDSTFEFTDSVQVVLHRLVAFDDLPMSARAYIGAEALLHFQNSIDGDATKTQLLGDRRTRAHVTFNSEHIRRVGANMLARPGVVAALSNIVGYRRNFGGGRRARYR